MPQSSRAVTAMLTDSLRTNLGKSTVFGYRMSGGEHPVAQRKQKEAYLSDWWGHGFARFFNPQSALLGVTLSEKER